MQGFHRKSLLLIIVLAVLACTTGCVSVHHGLVDSYREGGDFERAYLVLEEAKSDLYSPKDKVLYHLNAGMLAHYAGLGNKAIAHLEEAERKIEENLTKSFSAEIGTFLVNDTVRDYAGEDYEDVYANLFLALEQYRRGDLERMMVELRRADGKLSVLARKYEVPLKKASAAAGEPAMVSLRFSNSALIHYLSLLGYRTLGKADDVRFDAQRILDAFETQPMMYPFPMPASIKEEASLTKDGKARLNFVVFSGKSPEKVSEVLRISVADGHYIKIALPVMQTRFSPVSEVRVVLDNGQVVQLELIEDMAAVATETFRLNSAFIRAKTIIRATAKSLAGVVADASSRSESNSSGDEALSAWLKVFSLFMQVFQEVSEIPDLRMSRYFPGMAFIGGISLPAGQYGMRIEYLSSRGKILYTQRVDSFSARAGALNLVQGICPF
jgi:hypothetical protein